MINLLEYENMIDEQVSVICNDGRILTGLWIDWLEAEDAKDTIEGECQEDSILIQTKNGAITEVYLSEIKTIQKTRI